MLSERISNGEKIDIDRQEALKVNCRSLKWKNEGVILRSKTQWADEAEKYTKIFFGI